jgi:hypothetical protein
MAYVLGFFAADGSMVRNTRGGHFIEFTSTDRIILKLIREVVGSTHTLKARGRRARNRKPDYRIQIGSKAWFGHLLRLGFTQNKSSTLRFPDVPQEYLGDFVRGYFDGDGCVYFKNLKYADRKHKRWVLLSIFTSGSRLFLKTLWAILKERGIQGGSLKQKKRGFELVFSHRDSLALYRLMYHTAGITGLHLPRKYKLFSRAMKTLYPDAVVA